MFGSILGSMASSAFDAYIQNGLMEEDRNQRQEWQRGMYLDQKHWQTDMANNAHQRAVADMRQAGLNPMLAVIKGGAPVPSSAAGASPGGQAPAMRTDAVASAMAVKRTNAEVGVLESQERKNDAERALTNLRANTETVEYYKRLSERDLASTAADIAREQYKGAKVEGEIDEGKYGAFLRYLNRINPFANSAGNVMRSTR